MIPIRLGTRFYENRALPVSSQNLINLYVETQGNDAKSPIVVHRVPGLPNYMAIGAGPIRGLYVMDSVLYVVSGTELYSVKNGVDTLLGSVAGAGLVGMSTNDRESGPQLVICNGTETQTTYSTVTGLTTQTLTGPSYHPEYQDGYFIYDWVGTGKWFISNILDGTTFDSTEVGASNARPDKVLRIISNHQQVWVFGERSIEVFYNAAAQDFPFSRINEATNDEIGLGARWSVVEMDNTIFWVGHDREVYKAEGYSARQISDPSVSEALRGVNLDEITAFTYSDGGHKFYQLNLDDKSLVFDARENVWHQRSFWSNGKWEKHRAATYALFEGMHIVGDYGSNQLYEMSPNYHYDAKGEKLRWEMITPPIHNNNSYMNFPNLWVDFIPGQGLSDGTDPMVEVSWSNDARVYSNFQHYSVGKVGNYTNRAIARRLGGTKHQRIFKIAGSDPIPTTIAGCGIGF